MSPDEMRAAARALIDQVPESGLPEAVASLEQIKDFWLDADTLPPYEPPKVVYSVGRVVSTQMRPDLALPEAEDFLALPDDLL